LARLIETEVLNRLAVLILRGSIKDGETARVVMDGGRIKVLPNHDDGSSSDDEMDIDELDTEELTGENNELDLYD